MILIKLPNIGDPDIAVPGYDDGRWFVATSLSFGIDREMKASGEKGGTEDINIGVGELQECTISKSMDSASTKLAQFAINGNSPGLAEIDFVDAGKRERSKPYLRYKLDRCFVKSWSTSSDGDGRPTEHVSLAFNRVAISVVGRGDVFSWDRVRNTPWTAHGL